MVSDICFTTSDCIEHSKRPAGRRKTPAQEGSKIMKKVLFLLLSVVLLQIGCATHVTESDLEIQTFEKKWINESIDEFLNQNERWVSDPYSLNNGNTVYHYYYLSHLHFERRKPSLLKDGIFYFSKRGMSVHSCSILDTSKSYSLYVNQKKEIYRIKPITTRPAVRLKTPH